MLADLEDDEEEALASQAFRDALLNGDERWNRMIKLMDTRFNTQARRINRWRRETGDGIISLRKDLGPLILMAKLIPPAGVLSTIIGIAAKAFGVI